MSKRTVTLSPENTALVVVECQNGVVGPGSSLPDLAVAAKPILPEISRLARAARRSGARVVHLTYVPAFDNRSSNRNTPVLAAIQDRNADWAPGHHTTQVADEIGVEPDDFVLPRHTGISPTHHTELFPLLRNIGVTTVVLAGVSLNIAIPVAAAELADEGFRVVVARESVAGTPPEHAESMLRNTLRFLAQVTTVDEVIAALS